MMYCFDSSAVVKRYAPEKGSTWVKAALLGAALPPLVFVAADVQLCEAARREQLATENPNEHE